ncbi:SDR family NAD(P)-dependent oxidoreductase [Micromonospora sp. IBHARD004]|uniref:SDR family NAD(P)-dependent oxidoreductase n=1 Tax=Micromonospora sp. IBHARD004 TaxID=3457764 RepID=UPI0040591F47
MARTATTEVARPPAPRDLRSDPARTALVTGATTGIGLEVTRQLAATGWHVLLHARDDADGRRAVDRLVRGGADPRRVELVVADFARLAAVRDLASAVAARPHRLDLLVNNAAVRGAAQRAETADGNELSWQVNYLAHYLLTRSLLPAFSPGGSRVVNLSSSLHRMGDLAWDDLNRTGRYAPVAVYAQAKLALTMFGVALVRHGDRGLTAVSVHPGVVRTGLMSIYGRSGAPVVDGALAVLRAATGDATPVNGGYYEGCLPAAPAPLVGDLAAVERLWQLSARMVGLEVRSPLG